MSGFAQFPGCDIHARLDHPVIDADGHLIECEFAFEDFLKQCAGADMVERSRTWQRSVGSNRQSRGAWWGIPSGPHTSDRAMAMLPRLFRSRMDESGIDFAQIYPTRGITSLYIGDDELRQATCRALNLMYADMFSGVTDRMRPAAVIPTYTPEEGVRELEFAVKELGFKAIMIGTEIRRPAPEVLERAPELARYAESTTSIAIDSPFNYDPFWQACVDLKVTPVAHTSGFGMRIHGYRNSPSNYVFNHIGGFAAAQEYFCRSLFFGGVTRRFPKLSFGMLEGGVAWAQTLINDIVEHWEKRNIEVIEYNLAPANLDVDLMARLFDEYGTSYLTGSRIRESPHHALSQLGGVKNLDEFAACGMKEVHDLKDLFVDRMYFGCEADDRMVAVAFNRRLNPVGAKLKAVFGSDIGHWDVIDAKSVLSEAYSLVEGKLLSMDDLRDLTFVNPAMMHLSMNPDYYCGTVIEDAAARLLAERTPSALNHVA